MERKQLGLILKDKYDKYINQVIIKIKELDANSMLSGDDSNLENVWEEFAFQIQIEHSIFFEYYEETISQIINVFLKSIEISEIKLLWLSTDDYYDFDDDGFPHLCDMRDAVNSEIYSGIVTRADMEILHLEDDDFGEGEYDD